MSTSISTHMFHLMIRPGEKFKTTTKRKRGGELTLDDVNQVADQPDATDDCDPSSTYLGAAACVQGNVALRFGMGETEVAPSLALKTPRDANHLVK